jgi:hypothetical protein
MNTWTRVSAIVVAILGVVCLVFGIVFVTQAGSAEQEISDDIKPLSIKQVDDQFEAVKAKQMALAAAEEPNIQAGKEDPSTNYNYLTIKRVGLGLTRSNIGFAAFLRTSGIINIIVGVGLILTGLGLLKKGKSVA